MTTTLATLRTRVQQFLSDVSAVAYTTGSLDEALRQALAEYSAVLPRSVATVITLPASGREIALNSLDELETVTDVMWPFDSGAVSECWPPNLVKGFEVLWDDGQPVLVLTSDTGNEPQADDEVALVYTTSQHLDGLDGAAGTTIMPSHESWLVIGAAGYAAVQRAGDVTSTYTDTPKLQANLETWGQARLAQFRTKLAQLSKTATQRGQPFGAGWPLDRDDNQA